MKNYIKVFAVILALILGMVLLTGCGEKENNKGDNTNTNGNDNTANIELFSDDKKMVFNFYDVYDMVYYYKDDEITGLEYYYTYPTEEDAQNAFEYMNETSQGDETIEKVEKQEKQVIVVFTKESYKNTTLSSVKETYAMLEKTNKTSGD